jgi:hypothetical protein
MVYLPAILARQSVGSRGECSEIREYATSPGCSVDVMHGRGSLLRHNIGGDIVYCYPSDDFNGVKNFNGVVIKPVTDQVQNGKCPRGVQIKTAVYMGVNRDFVTITAFILLVYRNWMIDKGWDWYGFPEIYHKKDIRIVSEGFSHRATITL